MNDALARLILASADERGASRVDSRPVPGPSKRASGRPPSLSGNGDGDGGVLGFESRLWGMADQLWTNSGLQPSEYSAPVLALIFLKYAGAGAKLAVPEQARFQALLELPDDADLGAAIDAAMVAIEAANPSLRDVLPKRFARLERSTLASLLRLFDAIPADASGDTFGRIYEYFLGKFAPRTLQKGGEFFTPESVVKLIVEIVEPFHGRILDPACGSGGMFVQSARFVAEHENRPSEQISICGIEKNRETLRLAKLNLAVHGLAGDIREANAYYDDPHDCVGKFDFVLANPPFNQKSVSKARIADDRRRFPFGLPRADNGNFLWMQLILSALAESGRAGFVMANSTVEPRGSELEIAKRIVATGAVEAIVSLASNFFYTVTLPVTLWFFNRNKAELAQRDSVLLIDATEVFRQVDRAHRDLSPAQIEFLANIVRLYRGAAIETSRGSEALVAQRFPQGVYVDVPGLCKVVSRAEIEQGGGSLNPGRHVGVAADERRSEQSFVGEFRRLTRELEVLGEESRALEQTIRANAEALLRGSE